ncbi:hypothetical protein CKAH01_16956 [Colletotrichum kahawae]|uniref:Uncharacterized protein n=1 Tax=Colletotrichum kahawae TaxID=34407 RepID=A0AAE0D4R1_COLKA|nr:hypothetical protein CKAH01_16956 [Colletotrichum kahawae]
MLLDAPTSQPSIPPSTGKLLTDDTASTATTTRAVSSASRAKEPEPTSDPRHRLPQGQARSYRGRSPSFTESISLVRDPKANRMPSSQPPPGATKNERQGSERKPWQNPFLRSALVLKDGPASDGTHLLDGGGLGEGYHNHQQFSSCHETKPTPPPPTDFFFSGLQLFARPTLVFLLNLHSRKTVEGKASMRKGVRVEPVGRHCRPRSGGRSCRGIFLSARAWSSQASQPLVNVTVVMVVVA